MIRLPSFNFDTTRTGRQYILKRAGLVMGAANALNAVANVKTMSDITNKSLGKELSSEKPNKGKKRVRKGPKVDFDDGLLESLSDEQLSNLKAILKKNRNRGQFA